MHLPNNTEKRQHARCELLDYAAMRIDQIREDFHVIITNIGLGGLHIRSKTHFEAGQKCFIEVGYMDGDSLDLRVEVLHSNQIPGSDLFATGVRFIPESHEDKTAVAEFVHQTFQRQAE